MYSHIFHQTVSQNSDLVAALMRHTSQEQKAKNPELKDTYCCSDCTGSYASSDVLIPVKHMETLTGVSVRRYDFSEPQAGKGPCDRSSAHQKSQVTRYLNEGNDVMTALNIKRALESNNEWRERRCTICCGRSVGFKNKSPENNWNQLIT